MRASDPALAQAHRLLAAALPPHEVVPRREWREALAERSAGVWSDLRWHLLVAERMGRVLGMTSGTFLGSVEVGMIGYLALDPVLRGRGIGARLRTRLRSRFERDAAEFRGRPLAAVVGEVDPDNPWLHYLMSRRGALALDLPYCQPPLRTGEPPHPLVLYYQPLHGRPRSLPVAEVRRLLFAIWRRLYRVARPLQHPVFRRMLRSLQGRTRVRSRWPV